MLALSSNEAGMEAAAGADQGLQKELVTLFLLKEHVFSGVKGGDSIHSLLP